jgi:lysophospholipase L1-like esterase
MPDSRWRNFGLQLATVPLAPLLLAQGRWVRRRVPRLPEPDGARRGGGESPNALQLLILGDSAAAGVGAGSQAEALAGQLTTRLAVDQAVDWQLLAQTGHRARDALRELRRHPTLSCDVVLTSLGVNDTTALASPRRFSADMRELVSHLREHCGARLILLSGLPPMGQFPSLPQPLRWRLGQQARRLDEVLRSLASGEIGCEHLPFGNLPDRAMMASDGFHPGPEVYALWAAAAAQRILRWQSRLVAA